MAYKIAFLLFVSLLFVAFVSCQTFPAGERLEQVAEAPGLEQWSHLEPQELYRYYAMCLSAWRVRESYKDTDWNLDYFYHEGTSTMGVAIFDGGVLHIAFRGSQAPENRIDLKHNLRFLLRPVPFLQDTSIKSSQKSRIKAHSGFLDKYMSVRSELIKRVLNHVAEHPDTPVILLGHSGGGVLASIAFLDIATHFPDLELNALTFGQVRVFNRHGAAWFENHQDRFIRVVNGRDVYANIPPALFGYRHVGRLVRIGNRPIYKIFSIKDHYPGYRDELHSLLRQAGKDPAALPY